MIIANNLKKIYGKDFVSVNNLSFHIKKGEIVGFVGQNGAGKTTTIKMLTGILKPTEGSVQINGHELRFKNMRDCGNPARGKVGLLLAVVQTLYILILHICTKRT